MRHRYRTDNCTFVKVIEVTGSA